MRTTSQAGSHTTTKRLAAVWADITHAQTRIVQINRSGHLMSGGSHRI